MVKSPSTKLTDSLTLAQFAEHIPGTATGTTKWIMATLTNGIFLVIEATAIDDDQDYAGQYNLAQVHTLFQYQQKFIRMNAAAKEALCTPTYRVLVCFTIRNIPPTSMQHHLPLSRSTASFSPVPAHGLAHKHHKLHTVSQNKPNYGVCKANTPISYGAVEHIQTQFLWYMGRLNGSC